MKRKPTTLYTTPEFSDNQFIDGCDLPVADCKPGFMIRDNFVCRTEINYNVMYKGILIVKPKLITIWREQHFKSRS